MTDRVRSAAGARPLLSAHRGGFTPEAGVRTMEEALRAVVELDCEYVELDVQRCRDGVHVVYHDEDVLVGDRRVAISALTVAEFARHADGCVPLDEALALLRGRAGAHLDLKAVADPGSTGGGHAAEVALVAHVVDVLGAADVVVTGLPDDAVGAVRRWARQRHPELLVGLALGRDLRGLSPTALVRTGLGEVFPGRRLRRTDATLVVCQEQLARAWIARWSRRRGLPLLVWTVDGPRKLTRWLTDPRVWLLTTDHPRRAAELRRRLGVGRGRTPTP